MDLHVILRQLCTIADYAKHKKIQLMYAICVIFVQNYSMQQQN